ncbi:MAG: hypothetical protein ACK5NY_07095 [Burkholderiaceae bacterium]
MKAGRCERLLTGALLGAAAFFTATQAAAERRVPPYNPARATQDVSAADKLIEEKARQQDRKPLQTSRPESAPAVVAAAQQATVAHKPPKSSVPPKRKRALKQHRKRVPPHAPSHEKPALRRIQLERSAVSLETDKAQLPTRMPIYENLNNSLKLRNVVTAPPAEPEAALDVSPKPRTPMP